MKVLEFIVEGEPVSKLRHRTTKSGHKFTHAKCVAAERRVKLEADTAAIINDWVKAKRGEPLKVVMAFAMTMPKSWSGKKKTKFYMEPCCKKPDLDNLVKLVFDAINGNKKDPSRVWEDDDQVVEIQATKYWAYKGSTSVEITRL